MRLDRYKYPLTILISIVLEKINRDRLFRLIRHIFLDSLKLVISKLNSRGNAGE